MRASQDQPPFARLAAAVHERVTNSPPLMSVPVRFHNSAAVVDRRAARILRHVQHIRSPIDRRAGLICQRVDTILGREHVRTFVVDVSGDTRCGGHPARIITVHRDRHAGTSRIHVLARQIDNSISCFLMVMAYPLGFTDASSRCAGSAPAAMRGMPARGSPWQRGCNQVEHRDNCPVTEWPVTQGPGTQGPVIWRIAA